MIHLILIACISCLINLNSINPCFRCITFATHPACLVCPRFHHLKMRFLALKDILLVQHWLSAPVFYILLVFFFFLSSFIFNYITLLKSIFSPFIPFSLFTPLPPLSRPRPYFPLPITFNVFRKGSELSDC